MAAPASPSPAVQVSALEDQVQAWKVPYPLPEVPPPVPCGASARAAGLGEAGCPVRPRVSRVGWIYLM